MKSQGEEVNKKGEEDRDGGRSPEDIRHAWLMASWDCLLRCYMNYLPVIAEGRLSIPTTFSLWTCETMLPYASLVTDEHCLSCASVLSPCHFCDEERGQRDLSALKSLLSGHFITATETERGLRWSLIWIGEMRWLSQQEHLLHKCKDLSSNPQHSRKKLGGGGSDNDRISGLAS